MGLRQPKGEPIVFCFSNLDWGYLRYRKQHLMERLAEYVKVVYINPPRAMKWRNPGRWNRTVQLNERLWIHDPIVLPGIRTSGFLRMTNYRLIARFLRRFREEQSPAAVWIYSPHAFPFIRLLSPETVVYDIADNYTVPSGAKIRGGAEKIEIRTLSTLEQKVLQAAHLVLCVSQPLVEKARLTNRNVHLVPNGCDFDRYAGAKPPESRKAARPRIGYVGTIAPRFDAELVVEVARAHPEWDIEFVGPVSTLVTLPAGHSLPNIFWRGEIPYDDIPAAIQSFDVCILPLREIDFSYCSSPIQVWDYLAAGKQVVSTPIAQFEELSGLIKTASGPAAFAAGIDEALRRNDLSEFQRRRRFASENSWDHRVRQIVHLLAESNFGPGALA
jgi:glycosyltransferase involved in cell wall biosynthesis